MNKDNIEEEILSFLLKNLLPVSKSVTTISDSIIKIINGDLDEAEIHGITIIILEQLGDVHKLIGRSLVEYKELNLEKDNIIFPLYSESMNSILKGNKLLLQWFSEKEKDDKEKLTEAVDYLFNGTQIVMKLLNEIL